MFNFWEFLAEWNVQMQLLWNVLDLYKDAKYIINDLDNVFFSRWKKWLKIGTKGKKWFLCDTVQNV